MLELGMLMDGARPVPPPPHPDLKVNIPANLSHGISGPADSTRARMSHLCSLLASLRTKCNINQNIGLHDNYCASSMRDEDTVPSSTLWMTIPRSSSPFLTDDELMSICNLAIGSSGSIVRLTQANVQMGYGWFVECSNVDGPVSVLKNLRGCPGLFFQIEFSKPGNHVPFSIKPENTSMELVSPRTNSQNHGSGGYVRSWSKKVDGYDNPSLDPHQGGNVPHIHLGTKGPPIPPPLQIQSAPFIHPNGPWGPRGINMECSGQSLQDQWQGALCKSGVNYCTIYACRADSNVCRYSNATSEPAEWPTKLDMTRRTHIRHVKSTFAATSPSRREVCRLIPSSPSEHRRFQDFVSYLKHRDCAGVI